MPWSGPFTIVAHDPRYPKVYSLRSLKDNMKVFTTSVHRLKPYFDLPANLEPCPLDTQGVSDDAAVENAPTSSLDRQALVRPSESGGTVPLAAGGRAVESPPASLVCGRRVPPLV